MSDVDPRAHVRRSLAKAGSTHTRSLIPAFFGQFRGGTLTRLLLVWLLCCLAWSSNMAMPGKPVRRVLVLYEANLSYPAVANVDREIRETLGRSRYHIEFQSETLDEVILPDEGSQREVGQEYVRKYRDYKPDLIIAEGATSLKFVVHSHSKFFPSTPVVFCAVEQDFDRPILGPDFTGAWMTFNPIKTLDAALQLAPSTKRVVVVGGVGTYDRQVETILKEGFRSYESKLQFTYLVSLDMPTLLERLRRLPDNTIIVFTDFSQDAAGTHFVAATQSLPMVVNAANAPVFVLSDTLVGAGAVGGSVVSWATQGRIAAEMAIKLFDGEKPQNIPISKEGTTYMFDWQALKRWGMKEVDLPAGSIVLNRQATFWETYYRYVIAVVLLLVAQTSVLIALLWQRARRKQAEAVLRKSEEKFSKAFQRGPLAFALVSFVDYRFMEVNDTFERYTGWTRYEVIGRTPLELGFWVYATQRLTFIDQLQAEGSIREMEILFRRKDGIVRSALVSSELIEVDGGPCALSLIADITEAKRAERARRESEDRFRLVANTAPVMIWMAGADKLCTYVNKPWLDYTGRSLEAELGNGWADVVHPEDSTKCLETYTGAFNRREAFKMEYRVKRSDGEYRWLLDIGVPRFDRDHSFAGYIGSCIDVTERKLAEEALTSIRRRLIEAQEQERARIARELHDDINQRLAMLQIDLNGLRENPADSAADLDARLEELETRISDVSGDVQAISHRLHSSKLEYLGLSAACKGFCKELAERHNLNIGFEAESIPTDVSSDVALTLFRVLQECLHNAVKHSCAQHFNVRLRGTATEIQLTVNDDGVGFYVESAKNGHGLGLVSMRERVSLVKGTMEIASKPGDTEINVRVPTTLVNRTIEISSDAA